MKKKILAALSALTLGATMMAGTAMSASAADVYCDCNGTSTLCGDGGFYAFYQSTGTWGAAPHGMYDANIASAQCDCDTETVTLTLQNASFDFNGDGVADASGYISTITELDGTTNLINNNTVTLENGTHYYVTVMVTMNNSGLTMPMPTEFYFWHDCCGC